MSELTVETIGIDTVEAHPDNARVGDVSAIAESLERFGQVIAAIEGPTETEPNPCTIWPGCREAHPRRAVLPERA